MKSASYKLFVLKLYITNFFTQDHFHLAADFHKKMNEVRIKVMKGYKDDKASDEYYLLKKFNWLLFKNPEDEDKHGRLFNVERERKYNSHFKSYMNYYDLRKKLLEINNDLTICYSLKLELVDFYSNSTKTNAFCLGIILCNVSRSFDYLIYPYYPAYTS